MSELPEKLQKFVRESRSLDKMMRNMYLLEYAQRLDEYPEEAMDDAHRVRGCTSTVYVRATGGEDRVTYQGWSDAQIVKGMVAVLVEGLSGQPADRIIQITPDFIEESGVADVLTHTRQGGFYNIFRRLQQEALPYANSSETALSTS
jgi:cysteine desulfuration protein SufE